MKRSSDIQLPEGNATIIYDGACRFCQNQIARIRALDRKRAFEFAPSQAPDLLVRFPQLARADLSTGMRLVEADGRVHVGADAVYQISRQLFGVRWFSWIYRIPGLRWLARLLYSWIAARRQQLGGAGDERCAPPRV